MSDPVSNVSAGRVSSGGAQAALNEDQKSEIGLRSVVKEGGNYREQDLKEVAELLAKAGYLSQNDICASDVFDAVGKYQQAQGLKQDRVVGDQTWASLLGYDAQVSPGTRHVAKGIDAPPPAPTHDVELHLNVFEEKTQQAGQETEPAPGSDVANDAKAASNRDDDNNVLPFVLGVGAGAAGGAMAARYASRRAAPATQGGAPSAAKPTIVMHEHPDGTYRATPPPKPKELPAGARPGHQTQNGAGANSGVKSQGIKSTGNNPVKSASPAGLPAPGEKISGHLPPGPRLPPFEKVLDKHLESQGIKSSGNNSVKLPSPAGLPGPIQKGDVVVLNNGKTFATVQSVNGNELSLNVNGETRTISRDHVARPTENELARYNAAEKAAAHTKTTTSQAKSTPAQSPATPSPSSDKTQTPSPSNTPKVTITPRTKANSSTSSNGAGRPTVKVTPKTSNSNTANKAAGVATMAAATSSLARGASAVAKVGGPVLAVAGAVATEMDPNASDTRKWLSRLSAGCTIAGTAALATGVGAPAAPFLYAGSIILSGASFFID